MQHPRNGRNNNRICIRTVTTTLSTRSSRSFLGGEEEVPSFLDLPPIPGPDAMRAQQAEARAKAADDDAAALQSLRRRRRKRVNGPSLLAIRDGHDI